ncbi:hypothetical protein [Prochlorothrix hollandica]|uniref:hypothetical protein n=1 Tax=Prochlorothrix hollandica TaxID=1223 RepID=UPI003342859B
MDGYLLRHLELGFDEAVFFAALGGELAAAGEDGSKMSVDESGSGSKDSYGDQDITS